MTSAIQAFVFDAYGTLFDVHSVRSACEELFPQRGAEVSQQWRTKQLEYTWLLTLMARYRDFWQITESALAAACNHLHLQCSAETRSRLMGEYLRLAPFPEVPGALRHLHSRRLLILSNGTPQMLDAVIDHCGLKEFFSRVISVDAVRIYKPSPPVYQLALDAAEAPKKRIGFVSSNYWDIAGAKSFGFETFWINRQALPEDELGFRPDHALKDLAELAGF